MPDWVWCLPISSFSGFEPALANTKRRERWLLTNARMCNSSLISVISFEVDEEDSANEQLAKLVACNGGTRGLTSYASAECSEHHWPRVRLRNGHCVRQ
jgi:hypothetical protein